MFAPDHRRTASEIARVCRSSGKIGLASWVPDGFIGDTFRTVATYLPPPAGVTPPIRWGEEGYLRDIFGDTIRSIESHRRKMVLRFSSPEENVAFFRKHYGPTLKTFDAVPKEQRESLARELAELARRYDRNGGKGGPV